MRERLMGDTTEGPELSGERFEDLTWGQQRRLLLKIGGVLGLGLTVAPELFILSGCSDQGTPESTPAQPTSEPTTPPSPEVTPTAERQLEVRSIGGIEGELVEVSFNGENQKVLKYIDNQDNPFFALSTYPTKGPEDSSAEEQFEEQHVFFQATNENYAYLMLRKLPEGVSGEALPFYDKTTDKMLWVKDNQRLKDEEAFLSLNKEESLVFDEEIGVYWIMDASGKKESIKIYEPEPIKTGLTSEQAKQLFQEKGFCLYRPDGAMLEEIREVLAGDPQAPLEFGWNIGGEWIYRGHLLRVAPKMFNSQGEILVADFDPENPLIIPYKDASGITKGFLPLVLEVNPEKLDLINQGYYPLVQLRANGGIEAVLVNDLGDKVFLHKTLFLRISTIDPVETLGIQRAEIDLMTRITGEPSVYDNAGQYKNGKTNESWMFRVLENSGKKLAEIFSGLFKNERFSFTDKGWFIDEKGQKKEGNIRRLNEEGRKRAEEMIDVWLSNLISFNSSSEEAVKIAQILNGDINRLGFTSEQGDIIKQTLGKVKELLRTNAESHLQNLFPISMLVPVDAAKLMEHQIGARTPRYATEPPPGSEEKYYTSYFPFLGGAILHPPFYNWATSAGWPVESQAIVNVGILIHEGKNIENFDYGASSYPPLIACLFAFQEKYPEYYNLLQHLIEFNTTYMHEHDFSRKF